MTPKKNSSYYWISKRPDLTNIYPGGWDMSSINTSMAELITEEEFNHRVSLSTSMTCQPENNRREDRKSKIISSVSVPVTVLESIWNIIEKPPWSKAFKPVTEVEVRKAVAQKNWTSRHTRPFKKNLEITELDHVRRIAWMVMHPPKNPVLVNTDLDHPIIDGYHRFYAAIIRGDKMINVSICGYRNDIANLFGQKILDQIDKSHNTRLVIG